LGIVGKFFTPHADRTQSGLSRAHPHAVVFGKKSTCTNWCLGPLAPPFARRGRPGRGLTAALAKQAPSASAVSGRHWRTRPLPPTARRRTARHRSASASLPHSSETSESRPEPPKVVRRRAIDAGLRQGPCSPPGGKRRISHAGHGRVGDRDGRLTRETAATRQQLSARPTTRVRASHARRGPCAHPCRLPEHEGRVLRSHPTQFFEGTAAGAPAR
jgi:hypothetical protein